MKSPGAFGEIDWEVSLNHAMYQLCKKFYGNSIPAAFAEIEKLYNKNQNIYLVSLDQKIIQNSIRYSDYQANALYSYSVTDGQEESFLNNYPGTFSPPQGQGLWTPGSSTNKKPLQPFWGDVRTFAQHSLGDMEMSAPPDFSGDSSSLFYSYALEVKNKSENVDRYDEVTFNFWNDDQDGQIAPAGHMLSILNQIIQLENKDLGFAAFALMRLSTTLHDATVASWKTKYTYFTIRPETYIRKYIDKSFVALGNANSTPEYSSGQTAVASAAAEILGSLFGYNYSFTDQTYVHRKDINGNPRTFQSFQDMALEVFNANLLGGIHYLFSLEAGQKQGIEIARDFSAIR
jgi:hypothetical protein